MIVSTPINQQLYFEEARSEMCQSYSVLRTCGDCHWQGCFECTLFCHHIHQLGCPGTPSTYTIPNQGRRRCRCTCTQGISTPTEAQDDTEAHDDKKEASSPYVSQQGRDPSCSSHATGGLRQDEN